VFIQTAPFPAKTIGIKESLAGFKSPLERDIVYLEKEGVLSVHLSGSHFLELWDLQGNRVWQRNGLGQGQYHLKNELHPGVYLLSATEADKTFVRKVLLIN